MIENYGSSHKWEPIFLNEEEAKLKNKTSQLYFCNNCHYLFRHFYLTIPDIFKSMENQKIPNKCQNDKGIKK